MKDHTYFDEKGNEITETSDGYVFVNGSCVEEPGNDADFDRYAIEVMNGEGYYAEDGKYVSYHME